MTDDISTLKDYLTRLDSQNPHTKPDPSILTEWIDYKIEGGSFGYYTYCEASAEITEDHISSLTGA